VALVRAGVEVFATVPGMFATQYMDDPVDCEDRILVRCCLAGRAKEVADRMKAKQIRGFRRTDHNRRRR
jgi:hypothetical protein